MSRQRHHPGVAFMEDCDDDDSSIGYAATRVYAVSEAPSAPSTPSKPRPNSGKSRSSDNHRPMGRRGDSSASNSDSTHSARKESKRDKDARRQKEHDREERRRKEEKRDKDARRLKAAEERVAKDSSKALKKIRPPVRHANTLPLVPQGPRGHQDDPRAYGIPQPVPPGPRPRASSRPASYYAGQQPPQPPPGWPPGHGMPPAPFPVGTFPPPPQMFPGHGGPPPGMHMPLPSPSPSSRSGYLDGPPPSMMRGRDLRGRFEARPSSAMGFSPSQRSYLAEEFGFEDDLPPPPHMGRRPSHTRDPEEDRKRMPPPGFIPARPRTTANPTAPFHPPPQRPASRHGQAQHRPKGSVNRRSMNLYERQDYGPDDEEEMFRADDLFHISPEPNYGQRRAAAIRGSRHQAVYDDDDDDDDDDDEDDDEEFDVPLQVGRFGGGRRGSVFNGGAPLGSGGASLERDRYLDAMRYQDDLNGGAPMPLTAETLRKASKRGDPASSRSTRSSDSRDESEYRRSATTGITRSSTTGAPDDLTIKFSGAAVVRFEGAEIECDDGEITFSNHGRPTRIGSDRASTVYQLEDGRSRMERKALPHRPRAPSQSDAQSRYAPSHAPYHAPYDPTFAPDY